MKALIDGRRLWVATSALVICAILGGCINPRPRPAPIPCPTPAKASHSKGKKPKKPKKPKAPKTPKTPVATPPRFTHDPSGDQLQKLISTPDGLAKVRAWMDANGLKNEAVEIFIRADNYAAQRKTAASALVP